MSDKYLVSNYGTLHKYLVDDVVVLHNTFSNRFIVFKQNSIYINDAVCFDKDGKIDLDYTESKKALRYKDIYFHAVDLVIKSLKQQNTKINKEE